jgi:hypothetical protein
MAIDKKAIPDTLVDELKDSTTVYDEEVELEAEDPIEPNIDMLDDGGADINFGNQQQQQQGQAGHTTTRS